ncbi:hypothetical protein [Pontibacter cellulosilyticus]|uniref:Uncharacterized protein n=1 Tax=Pontibacter cellulosilyticus TaxID=1720253 RepID=A0A923N458_9BACT|nr:hypothetical protein [Pontibacter cellulosilyticus]MBC5992188.1 hypothetical protein [Pontibacter cellulosilyticus]
MDNTNAENKDKQNQENKDNTSKKTKSGDEGILTLLQPHDMSKTVESALHVIQGRPDKLPDLMHDLGNIILKAAKRMTTTQLVLTAGAITVGAVLLANYISDDEYTVS